MQLIQLEENAPDPLIGAGCTLGAAEIKVRLRERAELRDRSTDIRDVAGGVAIGLDADEPIDRVADLAGRESECCAFYTFVLRIEGERRELEISAGEGARLRCGFCWPRVGLGGRRGWAATKRVVGTVRDGGAVSALRGR